MTKLNTFTKSLFVATLFAAANAPIVNASELTTQLKADATHSLTVTMKENLNQVFVTINGALQKDLLLVAASNKNLVLKMAVSQAAADDKAITSVSE
ncbi:MAG: hypothetical protein MJK04_25320 [Psychrosphaera sp.]|nr:hypothetical protein [Psychrosphaera sp.]